jgi:hypothetical protein
VGDIDAREERKMIIEDCIIIKPLMLMPEALMTVGSHQRIQNSISKRYHASSGNRESRNGWHLQPTLEKVAFTSEFDV